MEHRTRFYIRHVPDDWPGKDSDKKYTIEIVDQFGRAISWGHIGDKESTLLIGDIEIPKAVIDSARRQPLGCGDFVDADGKQFLPRDF